MAPLIARAGACASAAINVADVYGQREESSMDDGVWLLDWVAKPADCSSGSFLTRSSYIWCSEWNRGEVCAAFRQPFD